MKVDSDDLLHAVFDVLGGEEIRFALSFDRDLPHVLK